MSVTAEILRMIDQLRSRVDDLERAAQVEELPSAAGDSGYLVQIQEVHPDSPTGAGDVKIYRGYIYGDGFDEAPTELNVTIRVISAAAGETFVGGMRGIATRASGHSWTDKTGATVTETVYYLGGATCP